MQATVPSSPSNPVNPVNPVTPIDAWEVRSLIKSALLTYAHWRRPGSLSGKRLNRLAGLHEDAEMPPELLGLTPAPT